MHDGFEVIVKETLVVEKWNAYFQKIWNYLEDKF